MLILIYHLSGSMILILSFMLRTSKSVNGKIFKDIGRMLSYNAEDDWTEKYFDNSIYLKFNHWFEL